VQKIWDGLTGYIYWLQLGFALVSQPLLPYFFGSNFIALSYTISEYAGPIFVAFSR
jgi:hypothetical protein